MIVRLSARSKRLHPAAPNECPGIVSLWRACRLLVDYLEVNNPGQLDRLCCELQVDRSQLVRRLESELRLYGLSDDWKQWRYLAAAYLELQAIMPADNPVGDIYQWHLDFGLTSADLVPVLVAELGLDYELLMGMSDYQHQPVLLRVVLAAHLAHQLRQTQPTYRSKAREAVLV